MNKIKQGNKISGAKWDWVVLRYEIMKTFQDTIV